MSLVQPLQQFQTAATRDNFEALTTRWPGFRYRRLEWI